MSIFIQLEVCKWKTVRDLGLNLEELSKKLMLKKKRIVMKN